MNSRERTFRALDHKIGDRIPIDFWASKGTIQNIENKLGISYHHFLDEWDVDFRYIAGPAYTGSPLKEGMDIWGVKRTCVHVDTIHGVEEYWEVAESPLSSVRGVEDIENYPLWPSPESFDYSGIEKQCDAIREKNRVVVFMGDRLNRVAQLKPAMYLRGLEQIFTDMALWQEGVCAILGHIKDFYVGYLERILQAANGKIDIVLTGDDFGSQQGMLISPEMWRDYIKPGVSEYLALIRAHGAKTMHHTCGSVVEIIPDMIGCNLDILQSVQPEAMNMGLADLILEFGDRICFQGGVSIQNTMPFGTADKIHREVKKISDLVKPAGGYIFCTSHNIQADTPMENILTLLEAYLEFGKV